MSLCKAVNLIIHFSCPIYYWKASKIQIIGEISTFISILREYMETKVRLNTIAFPMHFIKQPGKEINIYENKSLIQFTNKAKLYLNNSETCYLHPIKKYYLLCCLKLGKESSRSAGDQGSIPGSRRSPGERIGNPLQYSCLENPMDGEAWQDTVHGVTNGHIWLSD